MEHQKIYQILLLCSQTGTAATELIINGLNSTAADSDGLVDNETNPSCRCNLLMEHSSSGSHL